MDSRGYLKSYGWVEGEALKVGGLKRPILVKHKRDKKGLGSAPGGDDGDMWWETLFDGHLKNLNVNGSGNGEIKFEQKEVQSSVASKMNSPLYKWFVKGEGLKGTIKQKEPSEENSNSRKKRRRTDEENESRSKLEKSHKVKKAKKLSKEAEKSSKKDRKSSKKSKKHKVTKSSTKDGKSSKKASKASENSKHDKKHKKDKKRSKKDKEDGTETRKKEHKNGPSVECTKSKA
ncbi:LANO_0F13784g1_1 [Lachancea nothofagi CBS 11611]|uniref:LANO_0F13784g1_1 n=1 Tax=Lachancea nothofagi CBS 11611 TaxID=1266666 RepID=A0A1G4KC74_9SACH|nr:LANO_0F13784g1_1 [Lachancea nothofagi CBS 11611]